MGLYDGQIGVKLEGGRRLRKSLKEAGADITELNSTHKKIGGIVVQEARGNVPRRPGGGKLAGSMRPGGTRTAAIARAGGVRVPYANPIHWGWFKRGIKPNPWLSIAAQRSEPRWFAVYSKFVDDILSTIKGK